MKNYDVSIPITGVIFVTVEAESEEDAKEKAFNSDQMTINNIEEWEAHEFICEGNVLHASQNEIDVHLAFGEEE